jgi:hypothetical protein
MKKLVMLTLFAFISTVGMCNTSFGDDTPRTKSGAEVRSSSNGINWKKFHKKQKRKTERRKKHCNMLLML